MHIASLEAQMFDDTMESFGGAEIRQLVGLYLLSHHHHHHQNSLLGT